MSAHGASTLDNPRPLVEDAIKGDQDAWSALVQRYQPLVSSIIRKYRLGPTDAEDVSQGLWLQLVQHVGAIRDPQALPGWIATTTSRHCLNYLRSRQRTVPVDPEVLSRAYESGTSANDPRAATDCVDVDDRLLRAERQVMVREVLAQLPEQQRALMILLVSEPPVSYQDISSQLGVPTGSIGPTRARCLKKLRDNLAVQSRDAK